MSIIKQTGSPYWYYVFQYKGKTYRKSTGLEATPRNRQFAEKIEAKARDEVIKSFQLGRPIEQTTLGEAYDMHLKSKEGTPYHAVLTACRNPVLNGTKRCIKTKKQVAVYHLDLNMPLQHLKSTDLNRLVEHRKAEGYAMSTIKQHVMAVALCWKHARHLGYQVDESLVVPKFKKEKKRPVFLTKEEEQKLIDSLDPTRDLHGYGRYGHRSAQRQQRLVDQHDFIVSLLDIGCRFSELANVTWDKVNLEAGTVYIYQIKTKVGHTVHLTARAKEVFARRSLSKSSEKWVFPNDKRDGPRPFHNTWIKKAAVRAGIEGKKVTHHMMRKTFASKLAMSNVSIQKISQLLGHSDITTTMIYAGLQADAASQEAVAVLDALNA